MGVSRPVPRNLPGRVVAGKRIRPGGGRPGRGVERLYRLAGLDQEGGRRPPQLVEGTLDGGGVAVLGEPAGRKERIVGLTEDGVEGVQGVGYG